ncbi:MAG: hypothetical protein IPI93_01645 [Sphingobacteriaceae bacterium]|nr:hypothetical protein [Sphingobacteriaceae bacterium]
MSTNPNFHLFLEGPISITGSGAIKTTGARLVIHGTGAVGAVNFSVGTTPLTIGQFTLNRPGQTMTLGNDLTITSNASVSNGNVNLNGKIFKFNGANTTLPANAAAGTFVGSSSSAITFSNAGAVTGQLNMDQTSSSTKTLKALTTQKSLTLGNSLEITDSLKVTGVTLTNNGGITFRSSATLKGRIANSTGSISGNITVETFAQGGTTDWTNLGVSGVSGLNLSSWDNPTTFPMTCIGCINATTSVGGGFASAVRWDESLASPAAYVTMSNSDPLTQERILDVFRFDTIHYSRYELVGYRPSRYRPSYYSFNCFNSAGYNLISNPYASPIRWSLLRASNSGIVNDVYYVYDPDMGLTRSFVSGLTAPTGTQVAYDIIPAGQGFYVEATSGGNLTANESNKVSFNTGANQLLKSSENNSTTNSNVGSYLRINIDGGGYHDDAVIRFPLMQRLILIRL